MERRSNDERNKDERSKGENEKRVFRAAVGSEEIVVDHA